MTKKTWTRALALALSTIAIAIFISRTPLSAQQPPTLAEVFRNGGQQGAVALMEQSWENAYEGYFGSDLGEVSRTAPEEIAAILDRLSQETGRRAALVYLRPHPQQLEILLLTPEGETIYRPIPDAARGNLIPVVQAFSQAIASPTSLDKSEYLRDAQQLYRWIVAPIAAELDANEIQTILFCMGSGLRTLPLAALHDGERFLIERYNPVRIPAFNLIQTTYRGGLFGLPMLAMGASEFNTQSPLPAVPVEVETIASDWLDRRYLNEGFTLRALENALALRRFRIVHLATHAAFRSGSADRSYIQFWRDRLTLDRLREFDWSGSDVDLLVLSACETALGNPQAELGFAGLAFQAGVDTVIASLWAVSDLGTLGLMSEFYEQLRQKIPTKAEALRQAQLAMLRGQVRVESGQLRGTTRGVDLPPELAASSTFAHPFFWAAFTVIGSPW